MLFLSCPAHGQRPFFIGSAQDTLGNDWRLAQVKAVQQALAEYPDVGFAYTEDPVKSRNAEHGHA